MAFEKKTLDEPFFPEHFFLGKFYHLQQRFI
jgi:hypothetical protein